MSHDKHNMAAIESERQEEDTLSRQAREALQDAADQVAEEARRTGGTVVVWQHGAVVEIPASDLPPSFSDAK